MKPKPIPVIDLFAGPGGLGEGFSSLLDSEQDPVFRLSVSAEKDPVAHQTLSLRSVYRKFPKGKVPECYYDFIRGDISRSEFFSHPSVIEAGKEAQEEALCFELGKDDPDDLDRRIRAGLAGEDDWVLIGGPPCQAYSLAGRSRRRNENKIEFESDEKHFLYKEYLRIIREHKPAVFVMENVKGMLSSRLAGSFIFDQIISDLSSPGQGLRYQIRSFVQAGTAEELSPSDFIIEAERYGIPQARHRVILFGIRSDVAERLSGQLVDESGLVFPGRDMKQVNVIDALSDLPPLRSRLSREPDSFSAWRMALREGALLMSGQKTGVMGLVAEEMKVAATMAECHESSGGKFIRHKKRIRSRSLYSWLHDDRLGGVIQHETRSHMRADLQRYLFVAAYGRVQGFSPRVSDFPEVLLPAHRNIHAENVPFADRFRVQIAGAPSSTVVAHIAKDGHYFIHHDPAQCRSLTVRESARLQTFPDNYYFSGNRTEQYTQVGNAVPPLLARKIAGIVRTLMHALRETRSRQRDLSRPESIQSGGSKCPSAGRPVAGLHTPKQPGHASRR